MPKYWKYRKILQNVANSGRPAHNHKKNMAKCGKMWHPTCPATFCNILPYFWLATFCNVLQHSANVCTILLSIFFNIFPQICWAKYCKNWRD